MQSREVGVFVIAATVAAELHMATRVARSVSLTAKNARAIAVRAGQQTVGFKAITNFIDELAYNTIRQANVINEVAVELSKQAVMHRRALDVKQHIEMVELKQSDVTYIASIAGVKSNLDRQVAEFSEAMRHNIYRLDTELDETEKQIRAADIIATTSKVEASRSGDFRKQLEVIADNIQSNANQIKAHLAKARNMLYQVREVRI